MDIGKVASGGVRPERIISGGQAGADQGALSAASELGIPTGGTAPKGWRTEDGPAPWLEGYGLVEGPDHDYDSRTRTNVRDADGTVVFGSITSPGTALTIRFLHEQGSPKLVEPTADELRRWVERRGIRVLNVAGNRESKNPGIAERVRSILVEAFS